MLPSQIGDDFHHYFAVHFVVRNDFLHEVYLGQGEPTTVGRFLTPPSGNHRPQAIGRAVAPKSLDQAMTVHGFRNRLESEPK